MLELTGIGDLFRALGVVYWLIALGAIWAALTVPRTRTVKAVVVSILTVLFGFPPAVSWLQARERAAYAAEAWAHFRKLCAEKSGEKIYRTYSGVKSVLILKSLPPATEKDFYDQYWMGDPYSSGSVGPDRGMRLATTLIGDRKFNHALLEKGFHFIEMRKDLENRIQFEQIEETTGPPYYVAHQATSVPKSSIGLEWEDISTHEDRRLWVAGSRMRIWDLRTKAVIGERIGYMIEYGFGSGAGQRRPWQVARIPDATCPKLRNGTFEDRWFVLRVIGPPERTPNEK